MARFKPNPRWAKQVVKKLQKDLDKQGPVTIPVHYEGPEGAKSLGGYTVNYNGPTVHGSITGSVLAWGNDSVNVTMSNTTEQIASGFEGVAEAVAETMRRLPAIGLSETDRSEAEAAGRGVLAEVTKGEPDKGVVRTGATLLRGFLAPIVAGIQAGVTEESQEQARGAVQTISDAVAALG